MKNKGITLIALIITIVLLLIIAGVSVAFITGDNGILNKAKTASEETNKQAAMEKLKIALTEIKLNSDMQNNKLIKLNELQDSSSENYSTDIKLEKEVIEGDTSSNLIVDENYKFSVDTNFNITYLGKVEEIQLDNRLIAYTTFDEEIKEGTLKEELRNANYTNVVDGSVYATNINKKIGTGSAYFTGTGSQRLKSTVSELNLGINDFTVELWICPETQTMPYSLVFGDDNNANMILFLSDYACSGNISLYLGARIIDTGKKYTPNVWTHYAVVRRSGTFTIYENGVNIGSTSSYLTTNVNISSLAIGGNSSVANTAYKGYMDDFAIYNYAKYTSSFTPVIVANNNANLVYSSFNDYTVGIKDSVMNQEYTSVERTAITTSNTNFKFVRSGYFKGYSSQRLLMDVPKLNLGTNDFTIELWVNPETQTMPFSLLFGDDNNANMILFLSDYACSGNISLYLGARIIDTGKKYTPNVWTHYAVVRKNGVFTIYENGVNIGTTNTYTTTNVNISKFAIGGSSSTTNTAYKGYMDDLAIFDYAKYTGNFTVSNNPSGIK